MGNAQEDRKTQKKNKRSFWSWVVASIFFRLVLVYFPQNLNLASRPEVSTPLTSFRRLAEGYWLKQSSMSPFSGSMYHGSPLLLWTLGPLTVKRIEGQPNYLLYSLVSVVADVVSAMLIRATGRTLQVAYDCSVKSLDLIEELKVSENLSSGDIAALVYLWNPFTVVACVGLSTSPIENLAVILCLYGACSGVVPVAAFAWVIATHLSLYPAILIIPVILLLGFGLDTPPRKLFLRSKDNKNVENSLANTHDEKEVSNSRAARGFSLKPVLYFMCWAFLWSVYVLILCGLSLKQHGGLQEMFKSTYGFILAVEDLSPNIGVLWYFFAEVFDFFRNFFLIVFHANIIFMILPLAIRLKHRPCFLAFVYITISSMLKSYPSVGDAALFLGLLGWFINELADMQFSFFLFCGYVGVSLLSPVMHNLWIWRVLIFFLQLYMIIQAEVFLFMMTYLTQTSQGTGNANFYFATAIAYVCLQVMLVVESVSAMLNHDRTLRKLSARKLGDAKS